VDNTPAPKPGSLSPATALAAGVLFTLLISSLHAQTPWNGAWPPAKARSGSPDSNVPITATVQVSPPQITLHLHRTPQSPYDVYRKSPDSRTWNYLDNVTSNSPAYTDTNVVAGTAYEYKIDYSGETTTSYGHARPVGYILTGINVDRTAPKGRLALVVTNQLLAALPAEINNYTADLGADGWTVHAIAVNAAPDYSGSNNLHQPIRAAIQALYTTYPTELKHVILLGKVPAPRSGIHGGTLSARWLPDGHSDSYAQTADSYYAEMN
jgi:hypothetical protein